MKKEINSVAGIGYSKSGDTYSSGRPSYPRESIDLLVNKLNLSSNTRLLDLAAGTGKLTGELLDVTGKIVAVEPVTEMRRKFIELFPEVQVIDGKAEELPFEDNSFDAVVVATAFLWFDAEKAYGEVNRILRPGGKLALIWNAWNKNENPNWLQKIRKVIEPFSRNTPSYKDFIWKRPFDRGNLFSELEFQAVDQSQIASIKDVIDRMMSVSYISALSEEENNAVELKIKNVLENESAATFNVPYECHIYWCAKL